MIRDPRRGLRYLLQKKRSWSLLLAGAGIRTLSPEVLFGVAYLFELCGGNDYAAKDWRLLNALQGADICADALLASGGSADRSGCWTASIIAAKMQKLFAAWRGMDYSR